MNPNGDALEQGNVTGPEPLPAQKDETAGPIRNKSRCSVNWRAKSSVVRELLNEHLQACGGLCRENFTTPRTKIRRLCSLPFICRLAAPEGVLGFDWRPGDVIALIVSPAP